ncbi:MAG: iron ABC transporter permease [Anaerolineales bacterium]
MTFSVHHKVTKTEESRLSPDDFSSGYRYKGGWEPPQSASAGFTEAAQELPVRPGRRVTTFAWTRLPLARLLLWLPPLAFLGLFFFYPLAHILVTTFDPAVLTPENLRLTGHALRFTFYQAILSTLLTLLLGLPAAWLFAHFDFPGKSLLRALTAVPFMLPTVVVAAGFNALLGPRGLVSFLFPLASFQFSNTLTAILTAHVFYNTTIVIRIVGNALSQRDLRLEQAARSLGADHLRVWLHVILPSLRSSLLAAGVLVFLFDFTSFGVILLLGGPTFATLEVETYIQALHMLDLPLAGLLSAVQLLCTLALSALYTRAAAKLRLQGNPRAVFEPARRPGRRSEKVFVFGLVALLALFFLLPMLALPLRSISRLEAARGERGSVQYALTGDYYRELFVNRRGSLFYVPPIRAALNSLGYAALTVTFSLLLGLPAASALARPGRLERWLDPLLMLPLGASAVTLGLGFIITFNRPLVPENWSLNTGHWNLLASPWLVPLAHTMVALPFVIRTLQPALASISDRLRDAAISLGASPFRAWLAVDWPMIWRASLSAGTFAFTVSLGEFGATALLARPEYPTIPVAIYRFLSQPGGLNYGQAMAMATLLMGLTTAGILFIERWQLPGREGF